ncbi:hypothetical protein EJB05_24613, partial [Eragrostis curvula]
MAAAASGRALLRSVASRMARAPPQQHQRLGLHGSSLGPAGLPFTPPPPNMARTEPMELGVHVTVPAVAEIRAIRKAAEEAKVSREAASEEMAQIRQECRLIRGLLQESRDAEKALTEAKAKASDGQS